MWVPAHTQTSHPDQYFPLHAKTQWKVRIPLTLGRHHKADHQNTQKSVTFPKQNYYYKINEIVFKNTSYELEWSLQRALCSQSPLRRLLQQLPSLPSHWTRLAVVQLWLCCLLLFQPLPWMSHCFTSSQQEACPLSHSEPEPGSGCCKDDLDPVGSDQDTARASSGLSCPSAGF